MADPGHIETEAYLRLIEAQVKDVYEQAAGETEAKLKDYMERFKAKDSIKLKQVKEGKITQAEYTKWRTGQVMIGKRWSEMRDTLAADFVNADKIAASIVNGYMPDVYALNHNYATFEVEKGALVDTSYTLYDRQTVERLIRDQPDLLPQVKIKDGQDWTWYRRQVTAATTQGILQGESLDKVAKRMGASVAGFGDRAAIRNARTAMTGAQNAGRVDGYKRAQDMGIEMQQEWVATLDARTRDSHAVMDGERIEVGKKFSNGCRYPGDPAGPPAEVWNCRCTIVAALKGFETGNEGRFSRLEGETYDEWKARHQNNIDEREARRQKRLEQESASTAADDRRLKSLRDKLGDDYVNGMETLLAFTEEKNVRALYEKFGDQYRVFTAQEKAGAFFNPKEGIHINAVETAKGDDIHTPYQTAFHELGHHIDYLATGEHGYYSRQYKGGKLHDTIYADYDSYAFEQLRQHKEWVPIGDEKDNYYGLRSGLRELGHTEMARQLRHGEITPDEAWDAYSGELAAYFIKDPLNKRDVNDRIISAFKSEGLTGRQYEALSDMLECTTGRSYPLGVGHGLDYWGGTNAEADGSFKYFSYHNEELEFFAEVLAGKAANPESLKQLRRVFPNSVGVVEEMMEEMLK